MLRQLSLEHFKSWRHIDGMRLAPITGLFGTNSSGKTSILQWLLLLKQTVESPDRLQVLDFGDESSYVQLGTFRDVIHRHNFHESLGWSLAFELPQSLNVRNPETRDKILFQGKEITFEGRVSQDEQGRPFVEEMGYQFANHGFVLQAKDGLKKPSMRSSGNHRYALTDSSKSAYKFKRMPGRPWDLPQPINCYGFPDEVFSYYQNAGFLSDLELELQRQLSNRLYYLGPLRDYPRPQYTWGGGQPVDMGRRGEKVIDAILSSRDRGEKISRGKGHKKRSLEEYVAHWLRQLGLIDSFRVEPVAKGSNLFQVMVCRSGESTSVKITDVGFGISQILPVITLCYYVPTGSTIILEQPEIHLHPSAQAGLADVLIDAVRMRGVQIIVESHSEHLLRRLQLRMAEHETLSSEDVALYFCEFREGESHLIPLEVNTYGSIANWPEHFFGDEFGEMAAMTRATMQRMQEAGA